MAQEMSDLETFGLAEDLAATDILNAAKDFFDLHPSQREFKVVISDDRVADIRLPDSYGD
jgi:hypothetical protein